jgi:hypothetical protein
MGPPARTRSRPRWSREVVGWLCEDAAVDFDLTRLGDREFEHLSQALALQVLGPAVSVFGDGLDGGREAGVGVGLAGQSVVDQAEQRHDAGHNHPWRNLVRYGDGITSSYEGSSQPPSTRTPAQLTAEKLGLLGDELILADYSVVAQLNPFSQFVSSATTGLRPG